VARSPWMCGLLLARLQSVGNVTPEQDELLGTSLRDRHQMQAEPERHLQRLIQKLPKSRGMEGKRRHRLQANPLRASPQVAAALDGTCNRAANLALTGARSRWLAG
jgi:hypothetical protein